MSGPCLSSSVAGRPLRPATRQSLGEPLPHQQADRPRAHQEAQCFSFGVMPLLATCGINSPFGELSPTSRQIAHVLRTRAPLDTFRIATKSIPYDLHVLSTPPAFVLSQNQTLRKKSPASGLPYANAIGRSRLMRPGKVLSAASARRCFWGHDGETANDSGDQNSNSQIDVQRTAQALLLVRAKGATRQKRNVCRLTLSSR